MSESLFIRRRFAHSRDRVYSAFSSASALQKWFSPAPEIVATVREFEFVEGGAYAILYRLPDRTTAELRGRFVRIQHHERIMMSWCWQPPDPHADIETLVTLEFIDVDGSTELHVRHEQLPGESYNSRHTEGWLGTLGQLEAWLANTPERPPRNPGSPQPIRAPRVSKPFPQK